MLTLPSFLKPRLAIQLATLAGRPKVTVRRRLLGLSLPVSPRTRMRALEDQMARVRQQMGIPLVSMWDNVPPPSPKVLAGGLADARLRRLGREHPMAPAGVSPVFSRHDAAPSASWAARCDAMQHPSSFADAPEIFAAAHLLGIPIRVFVPDNRNGYQVGFVANPKAANQTFDVVLENQHFRWIWGGSGRDSFRKGSLMAGQIQDVPKDGSCFFHCLSRGLTRSATSPEAMRRAVVGAVRQLERAPLDGVDGPTLADVAGLTG